MRRTGIPRYTAGSMGIQDLAALAEELLWRRRYEVLAAVGMDRRGPQE